MAIHVTVILHKEVKDFEEGSSFIAEVKDCLEDKVTATLQSKISNASPPEKLTEEK